MSPQAAPHPRVLADARGCYLPILNFGFAMTRLILSDHVICAEPPGSERSMPRTRYDQLPGLSGRFAEVEKVKRFPTGRHGYAFLLHCTSYALAPSAGCHATRGLDANTGR